MKALSWAEMDNMSETQLIERIRSLEHELAKPQLEPEGERPTIKEYFGDNVTLDRVHETYIEQPELFQYAQALDRYIDNIESPPQQPSDSAGGEVSDEKINDKANELYLYAFDGDVFDGTEIKIQGAWVKGAKWMRSKLTRPTISEEEIDQAIHDVCVLEERLTRHYQAAQQPMDEIRKLQQRQRNTIKEILNR